MEALAVKFLMTSIVLIIGFASMAAIFAEDSLDNEPVFNFCRCGVVVSLVGFFASLVWVIWK